MTNSTSKRGRFIVIEGIDASGSTTQARKLETFLRRRGHHVLFTNEPSNGPAGMLIRLALARRLSGPNWVPSDTEVDAPAFTPLDLYTSALLFAADRTDHLATTILPALAKGHHVISDRYTLSSLAYQGLNLPLEWLLEINRYAIPPDLTIYLDVPALHASHRMKSRPFREDGEQLPRQEQVQRMYREVIARDWDVLGPVHTIDASRPMGVVQSAIRKLVNGLVHTEPPPQAEELAFL